MPMISFIAQAIVVMLSSWLFTRGYFSLRSFSDSILVAFILLFAQVVLVELAFGDFY